MRDLVRAIPGLTVVGEAASGEQALEAVARLDPELVLLISVDGRDAQAVSASGAAAVIRKQELSASALADAWRAHRPR